MKKKIICFLLIAGLIISPASKLSSSNVYAKEQTIHFSDSTKVTKNNVIEILDYLGIKHDKIELNDSRNDMTSYTLGELKNALRTLQKNQRCKPIKTIIDFKEDTLPKSNILPGLQNGISVMSTNVAKAKATYATKKMSETLKHDGYNLIYKINVKYNTKKKTFKEVTYVDVGIDSEPLPIVYKITKDRKVEGTCIPSKATLYGNVDVSAYIGVGKYGLIKISTQQVNATVYYYSSHWLK